MRKIKFFTSLVLILMLSLSMWSPATAATDPAIRANAVLLVEDNTGEILYSKNADAVVYPASTAKIMTALLAIEAYERREVGLNDMVRASYTSHNDLTLDGSTQNIVPTEEMSFINLLYCMMVASANEACNILGEYIAGGDISDFIAMMNQRAAELGCKSTHFANTHGLHNQNHFTTASDLYLIVREAVKHPLFMEICNTVSIEIPPTNISDTRYLTTTNYLISPYKTNYYYQYASGIKTGYTDEAGRCLISTASRDGISLTAIVMGAGEALREDGTTVYENFSETKRLYEWAFDSYSYRKLVSTADLVREVPIRLGEGVDSIIVRPDADISALLASDVEDSAITKDIVIYNERDGLPLNAPISAGQVVGEITVSHNGKVLGSAKLVSNSSVELSKYEYIKSRIFDILGKPLVKIAAALIVVAIVVYIFLVLGTKRRRRRGRSRGNYSGRGRRR